MGITVAHITVQAPVNLRLVAAGDFHGAPVEPVMQQIRLQHPQGILLTGDILEGPCAKRNRLWKGESWESKKQKGMQCMNACAALAPTFYAPGNHEQTLTQKDVREIEQLGVRVLCERFVSFEGTCIGGLSSVHAFGRKENQPDVAFLQEFAHQDGYKVLICHHPEYFDPYIKDLEIDLTVAGHAHGGQWRLGRLGAFAPGQGVFPKYVKGLYHGRLAVHTGLNNHVPLVPRIFNPYEILVIDLKRKEK